MKTKKSSTNYRNKKALYEACGEAYALGLIGTRWKLAIFYALKNEALRFSQLKNNIPDITERMLALSLRELEKDQLVLRKVYAEIPARVEYELTDSSKALEPVWDYLRGWGIKHRAMVENNSRLLEKAC